MTDAKKPKKTDAEMLAALKQREAQLKERIARIENRAKAQDRKKDARRKIIVGGAALAHAALDPVFAAQLKGVLKMAVTRDSDRDTIRDFLD